MTGPDHPSMRDLASVGNRVPWELLTDPDCGVSRMRFARGRDAKPILPAYVDPAKDFTFKLCRHTATLNPYDVREPSIVRSMLQATHELALRCDDGVGSVTGLWTLTASYDDIGGGVLVELEVEVAR